MVDLFEKLPFWRMAPNFAAVQPGDNSLVVSVLATSECDSAVAYFCLEATGARTEQTPIRLRLPAGRYASTFFNPAGLKELATSSVHSDSLGDVVHADLPEFTDDILLHLERKHLGRQRQIDGTG